MQTESLQHNQSRSRRETELRKKKICNKKKYYIISTKAMWNVEDIHVFKLQMKRDMFYSVFIAQYMQNVLPIEITKQ